MEVTRSGKFRTPSGFTLVELLVSMAIVGIALAAIYSLFISQSRTASVQEQVVTMQKNLRAAIYFMEREVRMAGYNPSGASGIGITVSQPITNTITFSQDLNGDGAALDIGETIIYQLSGSILKKIDNPSAPLGEPIAENIESLLFECFDGEGDPTASGPNIRQVVITVVARTDRPDASYTDTTPYVSQTGEPVPIPSGMEHYRRRLLSVRVDCRNLAP